MKFGKDLAAHQARQQRVAKTLRHRLEDWQAAFRQTPRVLALVWQAHPLAATIVPILTLVGGSLPAFFLYSGKKVIDGASLCLSGNMEAGKSMIAFYLAIGLGIMLLTRVLDHVSRYLEELMRLRLAQLIQTRILARATSLDMAFYETPVFYDKLQRAQREAGFRPYAIMSAMLNLARQAIQLSSFLILLVTLSWWVLPYLVVVTLPGLLFQAKFGRMGWRMMRHRSPEQRKMNYYQSLLTSDREAKEIRLFGLASYFTELWQQVFWQFYRQDRNLAAKRHVANFGTAMLQTAAGVAFYVYAIVRVVTDPRRSSDPAHAFTIGSLVMYTQAMERAAGSVSGIFDSIAMFYENSLYLSNLFEYLEQRPNVVAPASPKPLPSPIRSGVRFENVHFQYPVSEEEVLHGVSFHIAAGEKVAIVGENGAGKTTCIKLLARLYDPQQGRITVDGIDLRELDPDAWQSCIGVIFQDFARYAVTARENVGFGQVEALEDIRRIIRAAEMSGADDCIRRLKLGWENILGKMFDEGQELSLGEWQKVALARAFMRDSQILILDEPTASLDAKQEYEIFLHFNELTRGRTTILISHRFSSVRMADRILVIERGRLVESGSHEELLSLSGRYADLFNRQASGYR
jgi:ATP-binding cassette subfamily B protein